MSKKSYEDNIVNKLDSKRFDKNLRENRSGTFEGIDHDQEYMRHKVTINTVDNIFDLKGSDKPKAAEKAAPRQAPPRQQDVDSEIDASGERVSYSSTGKKVEEKYKLDPHSLEKI